MKLVHGSKTELRRRAVAWKWAGALNEALRRQDLRGLTDQEAWRITERLLAGLKPWRRPGHGRGLMEQQRLFRRLSGR